MSVSAEIDGSPPVVEESEAPEKRVPRESRLWPLAIFFAPSRGMERQAKIGRVLWFFLFAWVAALLLSVALAYRVDARSVTLQRLEQMGQLQSMSDRQIADEVKNAERVSMVMNIAKGVTGVPVQLGLSCVSLLLLVWFFRGRVKGSAVAPVAAATLVPGAIANLLDAISAYRHSAIPPDGTPLTPRTLAAVMPLLGKPLMGPWMKLATAMDFYSLWAAVILGFGVAAAGQMPKRRAVIGTLAAWVCWQLVTNIAMGGGGGGHGPGPHGHG